MAPVEEDVTLQRPLGPLDTALASEGSQLLSLLWGTYWRAGLDLWANFPKAHLPCEWGQPGHGLCSGGDVEITRELTAMAPLTQAYIGAGHSQGSGVGGRKLPVGEWWVYQRA